jgi:hypothetical protein
MIYFGALMSIPPFPLTYFGAPPRAALTIVFLRFESTANSSNRHIDRPSFGNTEKSLHGLQWKACARRAELGAQGRRRSADLFRRKEAQLEFNSLY